MPRGGGGGGAQALRIDAPPRSEAPVAGPQASARQAPQASLPNPRSYADIVALAGEKRDLMVKLALESALRPVSIGDGRLEVALVEGADPGIIQTLSARLKTWTGRQWIIALKTDATHVPTMREQRDVHVAAVRKEAHQDPLVQAILEAFPGATVKVNVRQEQIPIEAYADAMRDADLRDDDFEPGLEDDE